MNGTVRLEFDGEIALIVANNPPVNTITAALRTDLARVLDELERSDARAAVVQCEGSTFFSGADIGEFDGPPREEEYHRLFGRLESLPIPVVAAMHGTVLGGGLELALACDLRFAADSARLGLPEVSLGIIPGYGGTQRLPRLIGSGLAMQMILTGDPIGADEALRIGLVNAVFPAAELLAGVKAIANKIVSRGPQAVALAKQAVRRGAAMPLADGLALEADLFGIISSTDEMKEGMQAFLGKRKPSWLRA